MFFLGDGSAGKSTMLDFTKYTVECYLKQIKPDMFVEGKNTDKIVNTYDKSPYIRITWFNEPKDKRFDATFFKSWSDGECNAEKLYNEGSHDFKHYSLTLLTANNMPNIHVDGGTRRRLRACPHNSKFVDNANKLDEKKNIYLKDTEFKASFEKSTELKNALFYMLVTRANQWLKTKKINLPDEFKELITDTVIIVSSDHIKDFIDGKLMITNVQTDRVGKNQMLDEYIRVYPNKHLTVLQIITLLKQKGIQYDKGQGCFHDVKIKNADDKPDPNYDYGITKKDFSVHYNDLSIDEKNKYHRKELIDYHWHFALGTF